MIERVRKRAKAGRGGVKGRERSDTAGAQQRLHPTQPQRDPNGASVRTQPAHNSDSIRPIHDESTGYYTAIELEGDTQNLGISG